MTRSRIAGVVLPLFSIRSRRDWGIGQVTDLPACAAWIRSFGHTLLQVLPPYELARGETSPYGARTAFGLDPIYIDVDAVPEIDAALIAETLDASDREALTRARASDRVLYDDVRAVKRKVLRAGFARFHEREWQKGGARAAKFRQFCANEASWLDDLALYVALREKYQEHGWQTFPAPERDREPAALEAARAEHAMRILEVKYDQFVALEQWASAREKVRALGVELMGDVPFVVCTESADVWAHPAQFRLDRSLGAPPDAFSEDGQDWGLPPYRWDAMDKDGLAFLRTRTRHAARLYDRFRLDHVVGYFRMYVRRPNELGVFDPSGEPAQKERGGRVLRAILEAAGEAHVIAEDLGVIPPFVRKTLKDLALPGYRVLPWERDERHRLRVPSEFPHGSVATWSTHDTAPITLWWEEFQEYERAQFAELAGLSAGATDEEVRFALLALLFGSASELTLVLVQELLGEKTRINMPGTVGPENWTYRLPQPLEDLAADPRVSAWAERTKRLVDKSGRSASLDPL